MGKAVKKAVRVGLGISTFGTSELALRGTKALAGGGAPKTPGALKEEAPEAPKPEEVEESVDERRKRLSILRRQLPQNTLQFFNSNPNTRKKTLLGG